MTKLADVTRVRPPVVRTEHRFPKRPRIPVSFLRSSMLRQTGLVVCFVDFGMQHKRVVWARPFTLSKSRSGPDAQRGARTPSSDRNRSNRGAVILVPTADDRV